MLSKCAEKIQYQLLQGPFQIIMDKILIAKGLGMSWKNEAFFFGDAC